MKQKSLVFGVVFSLLAVVASCKQEMNRDKCPKFPSQKEFQEMMPEYLMMTATSFGLCASVHKLKGESPLPDLNDQVRVLDEILKLHPNHGESYLRRAEAKKQRAEHMESVGKDALPDLKGAEEDAQQALQLMSEQRDPAMTLAEIRYDLAEHFSKLGRSDEAKSSAQGTVLACDRMIEILEKEPEAPPSEKAQKEGVSGQKFEEALKQLAEAGRETMLATAYQTRAKARLLLKDAKAVEDLETALRMMSSFDNDSTFRSQLDAARQLTKDQ